MVALKLLSLLTAGCFMSAYAADSHPQRRDQTVCYGELGCFQSFGSLPVPKSPDYIRTTFELYRRGSPHFHSLAAYNFKSHLSTWISHFDSTKETKIVIHGYINNGHSDWIPQLVGELLKRASSF